MQELSEKILAWYDANKRDLPWRHTQDPYRIWLSEIMCQQTRVETVIPYYERFLAQLETIETLANCPEDRLLKLWEGLGYYRRVLNMQKAARECMDLYDGKLPQKYEDLSKLSGIGEYTAGAIASIAYGEKRLAIDGNVLRIFSRHFALAYQATDPKLKRAVQEIMQDLPERIGDFNQGWMDLGAMVCTPKNPQCALCPLNDSCRAYALKDVQGFPLKKDKKAKPMEYYTVEIYVCENQVLLHKRDNDGLLANLYEFVCQAGCKELEDYPQGTLCLGNACHVFSHKIWRMQGYLIPCLEQFEKAGYFWDDIESVETKYSFPTAYQAYVHALLERKR